MKKGTLLLNTRTGGIGVINDIQYDMGFTMDGIHYEHSKYLIHGKRTGKTMWIDKDNVDRFIYAGILKEWNGLEPIRYIKRLDVWPSNSLFLSL
jgi:hypothetical protein